MSNLRILQTLQVNQLDTSVLTQKRLSAIVQFERATNRLILHNVQLTAYVISHRAEMRQRPEHKVTNRPMLLAGR